MKSKKTVLIIGSINLNQIPLGGQESKNQILLKHLINQGYRVKVIDTKNWKTNLRVLMRVFMVPFLKRDVTILSLASISGMRFLKFLSLTRQLKNKTNLYMVLGGWFPQFLKERQTKLSMYKDITAIFVQSNKMKENLEVLSLNNIHFMPNYKEIPNIQRQASKRDENEFRFIYLSRIDEDKGAQYVIRALDSVVKNHPDKKISLDFYGKVAPEFEDWFSSALQKRPYLTYQGLIDMRKKENYELLQTRDYYAFLFYTSYVGEGFPGVILDAMILRLPMIVSDWNYNAEFVIHEKHGLVVPPKNEDLLSSAIERMISDQPFRDHLAANIGRMAERYDVSEAIKQLELYF